MPSSQSSDSKQPKPECNGLEQALSARSASSFYPPSQEETVGPLAHNLLARAVSAAWSCLRQTVALGRVVNIGYQNINIQLWWQQLNINPCRNERRVNACDEAMAEALERRLAGKFNLFHSLRITTRKQVNATSNMSIARIRPVYTAARGNEKPAASMNFTPTVTHTPGNPQNVNPQKTHSARQPERNGSFSSLTHSPRHSSPTGTHAQRGASSRKGVCSRNSGGSDSKMKPMSPSSSPRNKRLWTSHQSLWGGLSSPQTNSSQQQMQQKRPIIYFRLACTSDRLLVSPYLLLAYIMRVMKWPLNTIQQACADTHRMASLCLIRVIDALSISQCFVTNPKLTQKIIDRRIDITLLLIHLLTTLVFFPIRLGVCLPGLLLSSVEEALMYPWVFARIAWCINRKGIDGCGVKPRNALFALTELQVYGSSVLGFVIGAVILYGIIDCTAGLAGTGALPVQLLPQHIIYDAGRLQPLFAVAGFIMLVQSVSTFKNQLLLTVRCVEPFQLQILSCECDPLIVNTKKQSENFENITPAKRNSSRSIKQYPLPNETSRSSCPQFSGYVDKNKTQSRPQAQNVGKSKQPAPGQEQRRLPTLGGPS